MMKKVGVDALVISVSPRSLMVGLIGEVLSDWYPTERLRLKIGCCPFSHASLHLIATTGTNVCVFFFQIKSIL